MKEAANPRKLRVGVDARDLLVLQPTGVERVVAHFIEHVVAAADIEIVLFSDHPLGDRAPRSANHEQVVEPVRHPRLQRLFDHWILVQLRPVLRRHRVDAFYSINTKFPMATVPSFATVHGVEWYFHPQGFRFLERVKQWLWFQLAVRRSAGIVTFAENTRRDMLRIHPRCDRPMRVVPEGVDPMFRRLAHGERSTALLDRLGISGAFVLSVCSLVPRKNLDGLMRAFALMQSAAPLSYRLVLVGRSGWRADRLRVLAAQLGIADRVCFAGYLPDADLVQLYNQARLFVYPSKYEGFGLPPLEAMACGVPVVTSDRSATAEVARDAAILIDPDSDQELAAGMQRALTDELLRSRLIAAGLLRSQHYSWPAMTSEIVAFIRANVQPS